MQLPPLTFQLSREWSQRTDLIKKVPTNQNIIQVHLAIPQQVQVAELRPLGSPPETLDPTINPPTTSEEKLPAEVVAMSDEVQKQYLKTVQTAKAHGMALRLNQGQALEKLLALGRMASLLTGIMRFVSVTCPHCAVAAVQTVSSAGRAFGLPGIGGLGHWHADGTYHEGSHRNDTVGSSSGWIDNPFKWLEVDRSLATPRKAPALRKRAA